MRHLKPASPCYDFAAEQAVAAAAAQSRIAALACTDRLRREHFHDPRAWAVIDAALEVPDVRSDATSDDIMHSPEPEWWREDTVADRAGVPPLVLRAWCRQAPAAWDASGRLADRVVAAYEARQRAHQLLAELEMLGFGIEWKEPARV